jgi:hypothetical protein
VLVSGVGGVGVHTIGGGVVDVASSPCVVATTLSLSLSLSQRPPRPTEKRERDVFITPFLNTQIKSSNLDFIYVEFKKKEFY